MLDVMKHDLPAAKPSPRAHTTTTHNPTHKADLKVQSTEGGIQGARDGANNEGAVNVRRGSGDDGGGGEMALTLGGGRKTRTVTGERGGGGGDDDGSG